MKKRCDRNRKRSKRRAIYCPIHGCYLDSASRKYAIYADKVQHLQQHGVGKHTALMMMANQDTVVLDGEWLEAFWCEQCQETNWYCVRKCDRTYQISVPAYELWQRAIGVINPEGNPTVGEFTRRNARMTGHSVAKQYKFVE